MKANFSLKVPTLKEGIGNANEVSQKLNELNQALEKEINEAFDSLVNMMNNRRNELLSRLRNVESCKQATLAKQKDELENSLADLYTSCEFVEKALTHGSETEILLVKKQVEERLLEYGQMQVVTTPAENSYLVFEKGKKSKLLKKFGRKVQFHFLFLKKYSLKNSAHCLKIPKNIAFQF